MDKNGNNGIIPGNHRERDVYMILSPEGRIKVISTVDLIYQRFTEFVNDGAYYALRNCKPSCENDFFVHYRFPDQKRIPTWEAQETTQKYFGKLQEAIRKLGLKPVNTVRLYPAMYCYSRGLEPLAPENAQKQLARKQEYQIAAMRYSGFGAATRQHDYTGIETDRGVLLFDNTGTGKRLRQKYREFFTANFFDPRLTRTTFFRMLDVIPTGIPQAKINPDIDFDTLYRTEPEPFGELPAECYMDIREIGIFSERERYDMSATWQNFVSLAGMDKDGNIFLPEHTCNIGCLLFLSSPDCEDPTIRDLFPNFFSYRDWFDALTERFVKAADETEKAQTMEAIRRRAVHLLKQDYPNIRLPQQARFTLEEQNKATHQGRQLSDVKVKPAKFPAKKKGRGIR